MVRHDLLEVGGASDAWAAVQVAAQTEQAVPYGTQEQTAEGLMTGWQTAADCR